MQLPSGCSLQLGVNHPDLCQATPVFADICSHTSQLHPTTTQGDAPELCLCWPGLFVAVLLPAGASPQHRNKSRINAQFCLCSPIMSRSLQHIDPSLSGPMAMVREWGIKELNIQPHDEVLLLVDLGLIKWSSKSAGFASCCSVVLLWLPDYFFEAQTWAEISTFCPQLSSRCGDTGDSGPRSEPGDDGTGSSALPLLVLAPLYIIH